VTSLSFGPRPTCARSPSGGVPWARGSLRYRADRGSLLLPSCNFELNKRCSNCAKPARRKNFNAGRKRAQQPESLAKRSATQRQHKEAIRNWRPSDLPDWLTRDVYLKQVQPALAGVAKSRIGSTLGMSEPYSANIWRGKTIPHPRHWQALAQLAGISRGG
jgi:ribosome-binding protein aMBF1 (putative translation factor)